MTIFRAGKSFVMRQAAEVEVQCDQVLLCRLTAVSVKLSKVVVASICPTQLDCYRPNLPILKQSGGSIESRPVRPLA
jgi:hypothetical protein